MKQKENHISGLITLLVFALFALCTLLVLLTGAKVYRGIALRSAEADAARTATRYFSTRVHQSAERAEVESFGDLDALVFRETIDGTAYLTRVYCHEGYLKELFTLQSGEFTPADGEKLFPLEDWKLSIEENFLYITLILPGGNIREMTLSLGEVVP